MVQKILSTEEGAKGLLKNYVMPRLVESSRLTCTILKKIMIKIMKKIEKELEKETPQPQPSTPGGELQKCNKFLKLLAEDIPRDQKAMDEHRRKGLDAINEMERLDPVRKQLLEAQWEMRINQFARTDRAPLLCLLQVPEKDALLPRVKEQLRGDLSDEEWAEVEKERRTKMLRAKSQDFTAIEKICIEQCKQHHLVIENCLHSDACVALALFFVFGN